MSIDATPYPDQVTKNCVLPPSVPGGLEAAPQALVNLYEGANTGKMMVEVAPVEEKARL